MAADNPKTLWQEQATEIPMMTLDDVRGGADELKTTIGWRNLGEYFATGVVVWGFGSHFFGTHAPLLKWGDLLCIAGALFVAWQLHRRTSARAIPPELPARAYMLAYREELHRQRDALRKVPLWYQAPFVPGLALIMVGQVHKTGHLGTTLAFAAVMGIVFVGVWYMNVLEARRLSARIEAVEASLRGSE